MVNLRALLLLSVLGDGVTESVVGCHGVGCRHGVLRDRSVFLYVRRRAQRGCEASRRLACEYINLFLGSRTCKETESYGVTAGCIFDY